MEGIGTYLGTLLLPAPPSPAPHPAMSLPRSQYWSSVVAVYFPPARPGAWEESKSTRQAHRQPEAKGPYPLAEEEGTWKHLR